MLGVFPVRNLLTSLLTWAAAWGCRTSILRPLACGDHQARVRALDPLLQVLRDVGARNDIHAGALRLEILGCQHIVARWPREGANDYDTPTTQPKGTRHVVHSPGCHRARCRSENGGENIGSLVVMDGGTFVGIITERHIARNTALMGPTSPVALVRDVMETRVLVARPEHSVEQCMALMTERRVAHLPVLEGNELIGIVSIGDLVKSKIGDQNFTIDQLEHFIQGHR